MLSYVQVHYINSAVLLPSLASGLDELCCLALYLRFSILDLRNSCGSLGLRGPFKKGAMVGLAYCLYKWCVYIAAGEIPARWAPMGLYGLGAVAYGDKRLRAGT